MARHNDTSDGRKRPVEQYDHKGKKRANNPPVGLVDSKSDASGAGKTYAYDPHLDPTLVWAGKAERTSFEIPTVSLHVHERIDPRSIIEAVRKKNGSDHEQMSLFNSKAEIDETLIEACRGTVSLPFAPGKHARVAVKIVDDRGIESLKILELP
jgi:hypothetical protein